MENPLIPLESDRTLKEDREECSRRLNSALPIEVADLIASQPFEEQLRLFEALDLKQGAAVFEYLPLRIQQEILSSLSPQNIASLLEALSPDDRTALLSELPKPLVNQLLKFLSPHERLLSIKLLGYPEDSVGRLMTPDYLAVGLNWSVKKVLDYVREKGRDSETINVIYAVDTYGKLVDDFRIRQFLLTDPKTLVADIADGKFTALNVTDTRQAALNTFRKYDRVALPVVDEQGYLLGIVTSDDMLDVAITDDTEDIQKFGGTEALHEAYMAIPLFSLIRKRAGWLTMLFLGEMFTASAMGLYEAEIAKAVVLALFLPLIISSGGNAGSQASTLIIRALALGEVTLGDWWKIMRREILSGLALGLILGTIGFFRISLWSTFSNIYGAHWLLIAIAIFLSLIGVTLWGTLAGAMLPLFLQRLGFDPAASSAPFVATLVDVTGLMIYFTISTIVLTGTLL